MNHPKIFNPDAKSESDSEPSEASKSPKAMEASKTPEKTPETSETEVERDFEGSLVRSPEREIQF